MESKLYNKLVEYAKSDYYGFHMPGHKRNEELAIMANPYCIDITEIDGFDNLYNPEGIIRQEMDIAKKVYNTKETYFLINGSSAGNLAAISSVADSGDKIIIARNSHKSVYNAVELLKLKVEYLYPKMIEQYSIYGSCDLEDVEDIIKKNKDAKGIVITSPTYEGIVSDVSNICNIAHRYGVPVIVDAAHGAHFVLSDRFPKSAVACGADIVVESLHKTLPSFTQTAVLHYNSDLIDKKIVEKYLSVYQSTSPSYILMAGICNCINFIDTEGRGYGEKLYNRISSFKDKVKTLKCLRILDSNNEGIYDFDCSKIVVLINEEYIKNRKKCISGKELKELLNKIYHLEMEMAAGNYVIGMTSIFDKEEGFERLANALWEIDQFLSDECEEETEKQYINLVDESSNLSEKKNNNSYKKKISGIYALRNKKKMEIFEAASYKRELGNKEDKDLPENVSISYTYMYPPGIPIIVPGEIISNEMEELIKEYEQAGYEIIRKI